KMDALFGYSNSAPGLTTVTWTRADGTEMKDFTVPTLDYSRAEKILDALKQWNQDHPDSVIKVRGHVLVWHSQAPEWFFHEDWDKEKPDASPEEMDARQEWYIKTVLEHFTGEDSPYKGMFYGWDVVNEAVSDSSGTYRHDDERSSWWRVYQSEAFIVNAFRYANRYAPSDLELYYNDYNECVGVKVSGIEKLLTEVKSHEKDEKLPTRIDAMGMQSHHTVTSPTANQIKDAAVRYGKIVGKVQLTELDLKASNDFDGTDATLKDEYTRQAYRYKEIYDIMREVDAMDDIDVNGITVWGVIDGNSWLQDSSDVGGGADGSKRQVPLLFDDDYKAKPSFYAFVNAEKLEPYIRSVTVIQAAEEEPYVNGKTYEIQGIDAAFTPVWTDTELKVKVTVSDTTVSEHDAVTLYIDWDKSASENAGITSLSKTRAESQEQEGGYVAEFSVERELVPAAGFSMDVVVSDNGNTYAFNDNTMSQATSSKYYALAITKPYMTIAGVGKGILKVDGEKEAVWDQVKEVHFQIKTGSAKASASAKLLWDEQYLYVLAEVTDPALDNTSTENHEQDSLEVFIDENNHKTDSYEDDDKQYRVSYVNKQSFNGKNCSAENILSAAKETDSGYQIEAAFKWTDITPVSGDKIGIDLQINDAEGGKRIGTVSWYDESGMGWSSPSVFGTATLGDLIKTPDPENPDVREELDSLISECETFIKDAKEEYYTPETWKAFTDALEAAKAIQGDETAAPEAVKQAYEALKQAKEGLMPLTITSENLESLINDCKTLKKEDYTGESWNLFAEALKEAEAVLANPDAVQ
ncbi:MAG: endo-1,4-beta-xylanase, partial [Lachnospiraceae bacterium]|nr:endo-1,4-beta-xylanase [Lachnospiraceae bacterium]